MVKVELFCDTRERAIQDSINAEFTKPPTFAKTSTTLTKTHGSITCSVKQVAVGDYMISVDDAVVAVFERKTLKDYGASFKDNRHANKAKLLNARNLSGCQIYYIIEGPLNPDYETEYAGIKYKNIIASIHDLMIKDGIFIIRTQDGHHTARELRMFCESQVRQASDRQDELRKQSGLAKLSQMLTSNTEPISSYADIAFTELGNGIDEGVITSGEELNDKANACVKIIEKAIDGGTSQINKPDKDGWVQVHPIDNNSNGLTMTERQSTSMCHRAAISFEELQTKADLTPEEKLYKCRVEAWKSLPGVGNNTAIHLASQFALSDWISGRFITDVALNIGVCNYSYNGRRYKKITKMLLAPPTKEMQIGILAATNGITTATATELIDQYTLVDLLKDVDYSAVRYGKRGVKLTKERVANIRLFLSGINRA